MDLESAVLRPLLFLTGVAGAGAVAGYLTGALRKALAARRAR